MHPRSSLAFQYDVRLLGITSHRVAGYFATTSDPAFFFRIAIVVSPADDVLPHVAMWQEMWHVAGAPCLCVYCMCVYVATYCMLPAPQLATHTSALCARVCVSLWHF